MDEDTSKSKVNDEELDQMIANIKGQPVIPSPSASGDDSATTPTPTAPPLNSSLDPNNDEVTQPYAPNPMTDASAPVANTLAEPASIPAPAAPAMVTPPTPATPSTALPGLDSIKRNALAELRPLVDKLTLPPEEKFNTILLIIRSTDDPSLLPAAHEAARAIPDENHRAQALLNVIKEVDFFGQQAK